MSGLTGASQAPVVPTTCQPLRAHVCIASGGGGQGKQGSQAREQSGGANLLSLLLCASIRVVFRLELRLHSLIIYPRKRGKS